jgi:hypothetical protein
MKLLYLASNPDNELSLNLNLEITELQRRVMSSSTEPISIVFLPQQDYEGLPSVLNQQQPDILHLAAHGEDEHLSFANLSRTKIRVTADMLRSFMSDRHPPRLVYINACGSAAIAQGLLGTIPMTIGSTAPITNRAARTAAIAFYERILDGSSVGRAFDVCAKMMHGAAGGMASMQLFHQSGLDPNNEILHPVPRLIAEFARGRKARTRTEPYAIRFGLAGCPPSTRQIVFLTDDESFISERFEDLQNNLCLVVRTAPVRGIVWAKEASSWKVREDFRLYAVGIMADGTTYVTSSAISDALEARFRLTGGAVPSELAGPLADLRSREGSAFPLR